VHVPQRHELLGHGSGGEELGVLVPRHDVPGPAAQGPSAADGERGDLPGSGPAVGGREPDVEHGAFGHGTVRQLRSEHLLGAAGETAQIHRPSLQVDAVDRHLRDAVDVHEDLAALKAGDQSDGPRGLTAGGGQDDDVADPADGHALAVEEGQPVEA
jgi:hypothetical protein